MHIAEFKITSSSGDTDEDVTSRRNGPSVEGRSLVISDSSCDIRFWAADFTSFKRFLFDSLKTGFLKYFDKDIHIKSFDSESPSFTTIQNNRCYLGCIRVELQAGEKRENPLYECYSHEEKILEKKWEYKGIVHQLFIDFKKAYVSVKREVLYDIFIEFDMPKKLVRLIKMRLSETYSRVRIVPAKVLLQLYFVITSRRHSDTVKCSLTPRMKMTSTRRIDTIAFKISTRSGFIFDPTVRFGTNEEQPAEIDKKNKNIYNPIIPYYLKNYRLIKVEVIGLLVGARALERNVHKQLTDYLNTHNILDPYQSGFRTGHSTSTALLKVTEDIREALDKGQITILTLLDYSKAFDTVDVDLLIAKLRVLHFSDNALAWMDSYLRERQQCVSINNRYSTWRTTKTGVPQGSVLGPLLFSIYINDISSNLTSCRHHIYADDIQIYLHTRPNYINDAITKVNDDLNSISIWSKMHGLNLNASKSQAILIEHQRSKCDKQNLPPIIVNNTTIPYSTTVKNLGIYMDCHLEWNEQVNHTSKKYFPLFTH
ncbi:hypothetical protein ANN_18588 [Periplaneta americana]|uniref:Reverse transcriptase domain-containing protein n=1 Tax=Periplaneta americana TaxID=6978 RepID=A0ABQ8SQG0_PERAM|nr:hypothetical protein ANN_18588 [Periplaneta americana]